MRVGVILPKNGQRAKGQIDIGTEEESPKPGGKIFEQMQQTQSWGENRF